MKLRLIEDDVTQICILNHNCNYGELIEVTKGEMEILNLWIKYEQLAQDFLTKKLKEAELK